MVGKGNLAVFESSGISETGGDMPTKISVHALHIHPYLHELLSQFQLIFSLPLTIVIAIKSKLMYVLMDTNIIVVLCKLIVCM